MPAPSNRRIWIRLAWRHFRSVRVVLVIMLLAMLGVQWLHELYLEHFEAVAGLLLIPELVSACFSIVVFVLAFTSDRRQRTDSRLAAMGPTAGSLLIPIYGVAAAGAVIICTTGFAHALFIIDRDELTWPETWAELGVIVSMPLVLIPATIVFLLSGLVTRNPLKAIALGAVGLPIVGLGISEFAVYLAGDQPPEYIEYSIAAIGPLVILSFASVLLARRWCRALPRGQESSVVPTRIAHSLPSLGLFSAAMESTAKSPLHRGLRQMLALTWKEIRRLPWFLAFTAASMACVILGEFSDEILPVGVLPFVTFCGTMTFQHEQYDGLIRFYAERGVSRRVLIVSRLAFWGTLALMMLVAVGIYIAADQETPFDWSSLSTGGDKQEVILTAATVVQLLFLMGVWASITARTRLVAWTMSCVLPCSLLMLAWLIDALGTRPLLSLLPILIALVLGIWLRLSPWMNSRRRFRDYLPSRFVVVVGVLAAWYIPMSNMMRKMPIEPPVPLVDRLPGDRELLLPGSPSPTAEPRTVSPSDPAVKALFQKGIEADFETLNFWGFRPNVRGRIAILQEYSHLHKKHRQHLDDVLRAVKVHGGNWESGSVLLLALEACYLESVGKPSEAIKILETAAIAGADFYSFDDYELTIADIAVNHQPLSPELLVQARNAIYNLRERASWQRVTIDVDLNDFDDDRDFRDTMVRWLGMEMLQRKAIARLNSVRLIELANLRSMLRQEGDGRKAVTQSTRALELDPDLPYAMHRLANYFDGSDGLAADVEPVFRARLAMAVLEVAQHVHDHGRLPESVKQINPWTGQPFILRSVNTGRESRGNRQRKVCLFSEPPPEYTIDRAEYVFPQAMVDAFYQPEPK